MKISGKLESLRELFVVGDFENAHKQIKNWLKKNSPNSFEKILLSEFYTWMGREDLSWKILGPPRNLDEIREMDIGEACLQLRLAYGLGMLGAKYISYSIIEDTLDIFEHRDFKVKDYYPQFFQNYGYLHITFSEPQKARWGFENALELYSPDSYQFFYISLGLSDCDCLEGKFTVAISRLEALVQELPESERLLRATGVQALGEYHNYAGDYEWARELLSQAAELFGEDNQSKDYAYLLQHQGINSYFQKRYDDALEALLKAKEIIVKPSQTPTILLEITFWIEQVDPSLLTLGERLALRCYPNYSPYSYLVDRHRRSIDKTPTPKWLERFEKKQSTNCWRVQGGELSSIEYGNLERRCPEYELDLMGSCYWDRGECQILTSLQSQVLLALIGGGERGVHEYLLLDRVYRQDFIRYSLGLDRLKKAISQLKKMGFIIERKALTYFLKDFDERLTLILPQDLTPKNQWPFIKRFFPESFSKENVVELTGKGERTVQRWLSDWKSLELIDFDKVAGQYYWIAPACTESFLLD